MTRANISSAPLQIIALGVGDGTLTARLVQLLLDGKSSLPVNLCLVDISLPLLSHALGSAAAVAQCSTVYTWGINSDLLKLPIHDGLLFQRGPIGGRRLFCMLGGTLTDLENEPRLFQHSLVGARPGDMLLLEIPLHYEKRDLQTLSALSPLYRGCFGASSSGTAPRLASSAFSLANHYKEWCLGRSLGKFWLR